MGRSNSFYLAETHTTREGLVLGRRQTNEEAEDNSTRQLLARIVENPCLQFGRRCGAIILENHCLQVVDGAEPELLKNLAFN